MSFVGEHATGRTVTGGDPISCHIPFSKGESLSDGYALTVIQEGGSVTFQHETIQLEPVDLVVMGNVEGEKKVIVLKRKS